MHSGQLTKTLYTPEDDFMTLLYNWALVMQQLAILQFEWLAGIPLGNNSRAKKADRSNHITCGVYVLKWQMDVGMGRH